MLRIYKDLRLYEVLLNFSRRQKVLFTILFIFLILVFYLVSKEQNEKKSFCN